eukprot:TRINITY_DN110991_c0_g1_i1.p1 TRINITY_DN110991_c0_g1~~TRINITY_DN110991_c0_g1_i1.p1  ORF type:complete len:677 (-),score=224.70 TRINITY_DN110991_c0_g1_i1:58-2088(-)
MQLPAIFILLLSCTALAANQAPESPIVKVVKFIEDLKKDLTKDMETEQASYDKYVDWCEETISTANAEIAEAKRVIDEQTAIIEKMSGKGGASGAEIAYLKKSIIENGAAQKEARAIRKKEETKYLATKEDLDSGIAAMEGMLKSLSTPDNVAKPSFLAVDSGKIRGVITRALKMPAIASKLSTKDIQSLRNFAQGEIGLMQVQVGEAPASNLGGIVNVIKQTQEDYQKDLDSVNKEESEKVAAYKKLMKNLADELSNMQATLAEQESLKGNSAKSLADAKMLRQETETEKKADEKVLVETQDACKLKKDQFEARKQLREEELAGVVKALEILTSDEAKNIFGGAAQVFPAFIQIKGGSDQDAQREMAYSSIKALAAKYKDIAMVQLAMQIQRGHFDKVIDIVNKQIDMLRAEEQTDEDHRDRCQKQLAENDAQIQELTHTFDKHQTKIDRLTGERDDVKADYDVLLKEIAESEKEIKERGDARAEERQNHLSALQYDKAALETLNQAIVSINAFFKNNKIAISLAKGQPRKAPDAGFTDKNYEGDKQATSGLLSLMNMVREDMENEIKDTKKADVDDQAQYEKDYSALKSKLDTQNDAKISTEKALADLDERISAQTDNRDETNEDNNAAKANMAALQKDCAWVENNFDSRRKKRQAEIEGLVEAKGLLAKGGVR